MKNITKISLILVICISITSTIFFEINDLKIKEQNKSVPEFSSVVMLVLLFSILPVILLRNKIVIK